MDPKTAFFYWTGGPLPWLRLQSLLSFKHYHPAWEVVLGSPEAREVPPGVRLLLDDVSSPDLPPAARSDVWRYWALSKHGGFYADTDVIFVRPIDSLLQGNYDAWITQDMGTAVHRKQTWFVPPSHRARRLQQPLCSISIGALAGRKDSLFFTRAYGLASVTQPSEDYQSHGTRLLAEHWEHLLLGVRVGKIPGAAFYQGSSVSQVRPLWNGGDLGKDQYALHWYGGSAESAAYLAARSIDDLPPCLVRRVLEGLPRPAALGAQG